MCVYMYIIVVCEYTYNYVMQVCFIWEVMCGERERERERDRQRDAPFYSPHCSLPYPSFCPFCSFCQTLVTFWKLQIKVGGKNGAM